MGLPQPALVKGHFGAIATILIIITFSGFRETTNNHGLTHPLYFQFTLFVHGNKNTLYLTVTDDRQPWCQYIYIVHRAFTVTDTTRCVPPWNIRISVQVYIVNPGRKNQLPSYITASEGQKGLPTFAFLSFAGVKSASDKSAVNKQKWGTTCICRSSCQLHRYLLSLRTLARRLLKGR